MMKRLGNIVLIVLQLIFYHQANGQVTIWLEDFDSYPDGTTSAGNNNIVNPSLDWISGKCSACIDTADWWEIRSGAMEARDVNQVIFFQTEEIDISEFINIRFSLDITELGDHEGPYFGLDACADQTNEDYVNILYRIDGGPWNLVENFLDWCGLYGTCGSHTLYGDDGINSGDCRDNDTDWSFATVSHTGIFGTTLELRMEAINSADTEFIRFDNLRIEGTILLPVTLKSFRVTAQKHGVLLDWQTASESNNDYFQIERAIDQLIWEPLASIPGAGISNELLNYSYEDLYPCPGNIYYRLKQVDFDGRFSYSPIESVMVNLPDSPFPNPATDYLNIPFSKWSADPPDIRLFDISAKEIQVPQLRIESYIQLDTRTLATGTYVLNTTYNNVSRKHLVLITQ